MQSLHNSGTPCWFLPSVALLFFLPGKENESIISLLSTTDTVYGITACPQT